MLCDYTRAKDYSQQDLRTLSSTCLPPLMLPLCADIALHHRQLGQKLSSKLVASSSIAAETQIILLMKNRFDYTKRAGGRGMRGRQWRELCYSFETSVGFPGTKNKFCKLIRQINIANIHTHWMHFSWCMPTKLCNKDCTLPHAGSAFDISIKLWAGSVAICLC